MKFTNAEVAFLARGGEGRSTRAMTRLDSEMFRTCPPAIMHRILEARARKLSHEFVAFQDEQRRLANPNAPFQESLKDQLEAGSLF